MTFPARTLITRGDALVFVEVLGHYNPRTQPENVVLNRERLAFWTKAGAQVSDTVRTLVDRASTSTW